MKHHKKLLLIYFILCNAIYTHAQKEKKRVYFLVDTLNTPRDQRFVEIDNEYEISYTFFCKCLPPTAMTRTYDDIIYSFINTKQARLNITNKKPNVRYMSWKEFLNLAVRPRFFADNYELYITEALPKMKYRTNKVELRRLSITETVEKIPK